MDYYIKIRPSEADKPADQFAARHGLTDRPHHYNVRWNAYKLVFLLKSQMSTVSIDQSDNEVILVGRMLRDLRQSPNNSTARLTEDQLQMIGPSLIKRLNGHEWRIEDRQGNVLQPGWDINPNWFEDHPEPPMGFVPCRAIDHPNGEFYEEDPDTEPDEWYHVEPTCNG